MATLALGTLLKVGVAVIVTGTSIATPLLLKKDSVITTSDSFEEGQTTSSRAEKAVSEVVSSAVGDSQNHKNTELQIQKASDHEASSSFRVEGSALSSPSTKEKLNKTCFSISKTIDNDSELLTCLGGASENDKSETYAEYESLYYLTGPEEEYLPLGEKDKMMWSPSKKQITVQLEETGVAGKNRNNKVFMVEWVGWGDIAKIEINLNEECAIFKNDSVDSPNNNSYLFVCGNHLNDFSDSNVKGIPLSSWKQK